MKLFCNECKTYIEVDENDVKYTPGETVSMECPRCGEPIEFTVPSRDNHISQEQPTTGQRENDSVEKQQTSDKKDMSEMERRIQELEMMVARQSEALGHQQSNEEEEISEPEESNAPEPEKDEIEDSAYPYIPSYVPQEQETVEVVQQYRYDDYDEDFTNVGMFKRPFSFKGRIRRAEYWISTIIFDALWYWFWLRYYFYGGIINAVVLIVLAWFLLAQNAKRCHDRDNSGWYQLIPFYGLWLLFADGDVGNNSYGDNPKGLQKTVSTVGSRTLTNTSAGKPLNTSVDNGKKKESSNGGNSGLALMFCIVIVVAIIGGSYHMTHSSHTGKEALDSIFIQNLDSSMIDIKGGKVYMENEYITDYKGRTYLNIYGKKKKEYIKSFRITNAPITAELWDEVMGTSGWFSTKSNSGFGYKIVTHEEAMSFVSKLNERTNRNYSLPTQAQMTQAWKNDMCQREDVLSSALTSTVCNYQQISSAGSVNDTVYMAVTCLSDGKAKGDGSTMAHAFYIVLEESN